MTKRTKTGIQLDNVQKKLFVGTELFLRDLIIHLTKHYLTCPRWISHDSKSITNDTHNSRTMAIEKKSAPLEEFISEIKNSAVLKIKLKVNTGTRKDSLRL